MGASTFGDIFPFGWMYLNLNDDLIDGQNILQSHVSVIHTASGLFSVGYQAIGLDNAENNDEDGRNGTSVCLGPGAGELNPPACEVLEN